MRPFVYALMLLILPACFTLGCDDADTEIRQYEAPKDEKEARDQALLQKRYDEVVAPMVQAMPGPAGHESSPWKTQMSWTAPEGWVEDPTPVNMRVATYRNDGLELRIAAFQRDAGGLLGNINRWRGQMGLPAIGPNQISTQALPMTTDHLSGYWVTIVGRPVAQGQEPEVFYGAILIPSPASSWYITVRAPRDQIAKHQASIQSFVKSFKPTPAQTQPATTTAAPESPY